MPQGIASAHCCVNHRRLLTRSIAERVCSVLASTVNKPVVGELLWQSFCLN